MKDADKSFSPMLCTVPEFWGCSGMFCALVQQEDWFHQGFCQMVLSCLYSKTVSSIIMGLNIGESRFLGQNLLYDKIINKKMSYNQSLTLFKGTECNDCLNVWIPISLITICLPKQSLQFKLDAFLFSCLEPAVICCLILTGFHLRSDCAWLMSRAQQPLHRSILTPLPEVTPHLKDSREGKKTA